MGFDRDVDDRVEELADKWLDLQAELDDLRKRKDLAGEAVLERMRELALPYYTCSDGTPLTVETTIKVKGKRKRKRPEVEDEDAGAQPAARELRKALERKRVEVRGRKPKGTH